MFIGNNLFVKNITFSLFKKKFQLDMSEHLIVRYE